jgi:hypothetical protein
MHASLIKCDCESIAVGRVEEVVGREVAPALGVDRRDPAERTETNNRIERIMGQAVPDDDSLI